MSAGIPLAWLQLTREKRRFLAALLGISFAVVLMLTQLGFRDALLSSVGMMHSNFIGDLVLINPNYRNLVTTRTFTERRLYQVLSSNAVDSVYPLYLDSASFKNPVDRQEHTIYVIGFKPATAVLNMPGIPENLSKIRDVGTALFDSIHRPEFGPVETIFEQSGPVVTEIAGKRVDIVGLFQLGTSFGSDAHVVVSDETFVHLMPYRQLGIIDVGLIKLKPGADLVRTKSELARILPADVEIITKEEFVNREVTYWTTSTPIGFVFALGVLVGLFVGCIIVYQILYSDVTDHLPEYATLKAMGYTDGFLFKVVMKEALILSVLGFFPGVVVAQFVYAAARHATLLPMEITLSRGVAVYFLTAIMCSISALLAVRRLKAADPAAIF
jgi:putative ABC transport system permease protein